MKISPLVKNNKILIIVLAITFVCACVMIIECLSVYRDIQKIMDKIVEEDKAIQRINGAKKPNPVRESEKIIRANTDEYRKKIRDIRRRLGNPNREALKEFLGNLESADFLRSAPLPPAELDTRGAAARNTAEAVPEDPVTLRYTEDEIRSAFAQLYNDYYSNRKNTDVSYADNDRLEDERVAIFDKFRDKLIQQLPPGKKEFSSEEERKKHLAGARQSFEKAFHHFLLRIYKDTLKDVDMKKDAEFVLKDAKFIFMDSLGLPRTMTSFHCKVYVDEVSNYIRKNPSVIPGLDLWAKNPSGKGNEGGIESRIQEFTYNHQNTMPHPTNVVHILRHYRILEDLFHRMRDSHIQILMEVKSPFSKNAPGKLDGDPYPEMGSDYKKFVYEVTVISTGAEIRNFINQLHHAFEQNIVYEIQEISFVKTPQLDDVKSAAEKVDALRKAAGKGADGKDAPRESSAAAQTEGTASAGPRRPEDIYADPEYGIPLVGQKDLVQAVIKFNYVLYDGETLGKK